MSAPSTLQKNDTIKHKKKRSGATSLERRKKEKKRVQKKRKASKHLSYSKKKTEKNSFLILFLEPPFSSLFIPLLCSAGARA